MKILDLLKNLISKNKKLRLNALNIDMNATIKMITIDSIEQIIKNPEVYEKFRSYEKNQSFFGDEIEKNDYIRAIKNYSDFMKENGIKLSKKENRRIKKILNGVSFSNENKMKKDKLFEGEKRERIYHVLQNILEDDKSFEEFCELDDKFNGIEKGIIEKYAYSELAELYNNIEHSKEQNNRMNFIKSTFLLKEKSTKMNADFEINHDFEDSIMKNIDKNLVGEELAFAIYNELNKKVKYNSAFFALNQDLDDEFAKSIYDKKIIEVSNKDNKIVCKTWAELYAYLLAKNGMESYVTSNGKHKYVNVFNGKTWIEADATNLTNSNEDESKLTDLTRCKLGLKPAGFKIYSYDNNEIDVGKEMDVVKSDYTDVDYKKFENTEELAELLTLIDGNENLSNKLFEVESEESTFKVILKKLKYISELISNLKLDNMDSVGYIGHLYRNIFTEEEKNRVSLSNALYENVYADCNILPVISIYKGNFGEDNEKLDDNYSFLLFFQDNHIMKKISKEEIIKIIECKKIGRIKADDKYRTIDGIPETEMELEKNEQLQKIEEVQKSKIENKSKMISDEGR